MKYKDSGVNIDGANSTVKTIKRIVKSTFSEAVLSNIGAFGSMYDGKFAGIKEPVLVSSADGVGTKMIIAEEADYFEKCGEDIVNHSVNDILSVGAKGLYFLDYIGMGKLEQKKVERIILSMSKACKANSVSLIGGELAEMSAVYNYTHYDVVGFIVGVAEKRDLMKKERIKKDNVIIGLHSSGFHTNGYTLIRKILSENKINIKKTFPFSKKKIYELLLEPHRSYFKPVYPLVRERVINGIAHITGGGFVDNIERVLPENVDAVIDASKWRVPSLFSYICSLGKVSFEDAYRTFNMGIGMVLITDKKNLPHIENSLKKVKIGYDVIGRTSSGSGSVYVLKRS
ncbi:MAG: phosphoribosylformylglycinamidine cyclo-ligase [bacterium]|nr:phosphoribosylformylglycinamidine cyclo-ligase [bacterium]